MDGSADENQGAVPDEIDAVANVTEDVILLLDTELTVQAAAGLESSTLGHTETQLLGKSAEMLFAASAAETFDIETAEGFRAAICDEETADLTVPLAAADNTAVPVSVSVTAWKDGGYLCVVRERSGHGAADSELLDTVADPVYALDSEGRFTRVNDAMVELTGYDRADLLGRALAEIVPPSSDERLSSEQESLRKDSRQTATTELTVITNDGELIVTEVHVTIRTTEDGEYAGAVGVLRDIRERKRRERTLDLLKQVLTRVFRHNVRNELMVAMTHAELLETQLDPERQSHTTEILASVERLLDHSEKARQLEGIIEHRGNAEVEMTGTIRAVVDEARDRHQEATITLDLPTAWTVEAHPDIDRAVEELVENAIVHATDEPQLRIWIDQEDRGETLFLEDESGGLAPEEIQVLRSGTEEKLHHGSGVGLWLVRWLVEYSDAELIVHRTGGGTVIGIRFGRRENKTIDDSPLAKAPEHVRETEPERFHGDTVIGRREPLDQLDGRFDDLERTGGQTVLVTGEAGIGKTTLVEQFQERLAQRDDSSVVVTGFCNETIQPPYYAFQQILRELPGEENPLAGATSATADGIDKLAEQKEALFDEVAEQLRAVASDQPVVLVVEDMQWADQGTVALFEHLVDAVGKWSYPVLFVGTYRTSDVEESHPVLEIADETTEAGRGTVLELAPLKESEVNSLLTQLLDIDDVPASLAGEFYEHTGGTPLFVQELGRNLAEQVGPITEPDDLPANLDDITVPETAERAIADRLEGLPDHARLALKFGAVIGTEFSFDLLRAAADRPVDTLIDCVDTLVERQLWNRTGNELEFAHGIIRDQTLENIDEDSRTQLHERVAAAIETVHADALDEYAATLATHYEQIGASDTAFEYYRQAGEYAADQYANQDAIFQYERALSLADEHDLSKDEEVVAVSTALGRTFELIGEYDKARDCYEDGLARCKQTDSKGEADCLDGLGRIARKQGEYEQSKKRLERSIEIRQKVGDPQGKATTLKNLGDIAFRQTEYELAREHYDQSLDIYRETGDQHGQATSLLNLSMVAWQWGQYSQAKEYAEQALEFVREISDSKLESRTLIHLGNIVRKRGSHERFRKYNERSFELSREIGFKQGKSSSLHNLGLSAKSRGEYGQAKEFLKQSLGIKRETGDRRGETQTLSTLAMVATRQGQYEQSYDYLKESSDILEEFCSDWTEALNLCWRAKTALREDRDEQASEWAKDGLQIAKRIESGELKLIGHWVLGTVARRQDSYNEAVEHLNEALAAIEADKNRRNQTLVYLERARLALAREDIEAARDAVAEAAEITSELGMIHDQARVTHLHGRIAAEAGSPDEATDHWQQALDTFEEIGAPQDALKTLRQLIESCTKRDGDTEQWIDKAVGILGDAPDPVQNQHRDWLADHSDEINQR